MRRRDLIKGIAGSAAAWPLAAHAQQPATPIVGFLRSTSLAPFQNLGVALGQGLKEAGFIEGQNVTIEYRYAENQIDRQPALSGRLDPLARGRDCSEHGRGVCGQCRDNDDPDCLCCWWRSGQEWARRQSEPARRQHHWRELSHLPGRTEATRVAAPGLPKATTIAMLVNPNMPETEPERKDVQAAARAIGLQLITFDVSSDRDIETAFATLVSGGAGALLVGTGAFLASTRESIIALAARDAIPAMYQLREEVWPVV
jgi:hypothetical protein